MPNIDNTQSRFQPLKAVVRHPVQAVTRLESDPTHPKNVQRAKAELVPEVESATDKKPLIGSGKSYSSAKEIGPYPKRHNEIQEQQDADRAQWLEDNKDVLQRRENRRAKVKSVAGRAAVAGLAVTGAATLGVGGAVATGAATPGQVIESVGNVVESTNNALDRVIGGQTDGSPETDEQRRLGSTGTVPAAPEGVDPTVYGQVEATTQGQ